MSKICLCAVDVQNVNVEKLQKILVEQCEKSGNGVSVR